MHAIGSAKPAPKDDREVTLATSWPTVMFAPREKPGPGILFPGCDSRQHKMTHVISSCRAVRRCELGCCAICRVDAAIRKSYCHRAGKMCGRQVRRFVRRGPERNAPPAWRRTGRLRARAPRGSNALPVSYNAANMIGKRQCDAKCVIAELRDVEFIERGESGERMRLHSLRSRIHCAKIYACSIRQTIVTSTLE